MTLFQINKLLQNLRLGIYDAERYHITPYREEKTKRLGLLFYDTNENVGFDMLFHKGWKHYVTIKDDDIMFNENKVIPKEIYDSFITYIQNAREKEKAEDEKLITKAYNL